MNKYKIQKSVFLLKLIFLLYYEKYPPLSCAIGEMNKYKIKKSVFLLKLISLLYYEKSIFLLLHETFKMLLKQTAFG
jgi:hypothetical protein